MEPAMLTATEIAGFAGAGLAGAAYVPQISHLIRARCSAGISRLAFEVWLLASVLTTVRAVAIHAGVFIALGGIQIAATTVIMLCATRYKDTTCPSHLPRPPRAKTAARTGAPGNESRSGRPAGRSKAESATPAEHSGALRAYVRVCTRSVIRSPPGLARAPDARAGCSWPKSRMAAAVPYADGARPGKRGSAPIFKRRT